MNARARTLAVVGAGHALNAMAGGFVFPFFAVYLHDHAPARGGVWVGSVFALITLLSAIGRAGGGELADRRGRRFVLIGAVGLRSLALVATGAAAAAQASPVVVSATLLLFALPRGAFEPAADAMIADLVPPPARPRAYAQMRIARNAGWTIGPALGGFIGEQRFPLLALAAGGLGLVTLVLSLAYLEETPHRAAVAARFRVRDLGLALRDPVFRRHCLLTAGLFVLFAQLLVSVSVDFAVRVKLSSFEIGCAYTFNGILVVLFQAATTRAVAPLRPGHALAAGALLDGAGYLLIGTAWRLPQALAGVAVVTAGEMITLPVSASLAADLAPDEQRGRFLGVYGVFMDAGNGLGQVLGGTGLAAAARHPLWFWWGMGAVAVAVAAGYLRFARQQGSRPPPSLTSTFFGAE